MPTRWWMLLRIVLLAIAGLMATWGADNLHLAGYLHGLPDATPQTSAAVEAIYWTKGLWWLGGATLLLWAALGPMKPGSGDDTIALILWGGLIVVDGATAYWSGNNFDQSAPQVIWVVLYLAAPIAALLLCVPLIRELLQAAQHDDDAESHERDA